MRFRAMLAITLIVSTFPLGSLSAAPISDDTFERTWARTDAPVAEEQVTRTWMWGPSAYSGLLVEPYADSPGGERKVQYFDKSRMEITHPDADPVDLWYVTNGLLATELMTGEMQLGDDEFVSHQPAAVQIAGDPDSSAPTYAMFGELMGASAHDPSEPITATLDSSGTVGNDEAMAIHNVVPEHAVEQTGHTVASVFWEFMNSSGTVYEHGETFEDLLFENPFFAVGLPVTGAYWVEVPVGGVERHVLVQCFERRCLTYTPENDPGWRVEAGNIGQHYYEWRYEQLGLEPAAPAYSEVLGPAGGSLQADGGTFALNVPAGALDTQTEFSAQRDLSTQSDDDSVLAIYDVGPGNTTFQQSIEVLVTIDQRELPSETSLEDVVLYRFTGDSWEPLDDVSHNPETSIVRGFTDRFSRIGISTMDDALPLAPLPPDETRPFDEQFAGWEVDVLARHFDDHVHMSVHRCYDDEFGVFSFSYQVSFADSDEPLGFEHTEIFDLEGDDGAQDAFGEFPVYDEQEVCGPVGCTTVYLNGTFFYYIVDVPDLHTVVVEIELDAVMYNADDPGEYEVPDPFAGGGSFDKEPIDDRVCL